MQYVIMLIMPIRQYIVACRKCKEDRLRPSPRSFICGPCKAPGEKYRRAFYYNKKKVFVRDGNRCQCCGDHSNLVAHHIDCNKQNNSISNLITLCNQCHVSIHRTYTNEQLKNSIIYNLFPNRFRWGKFGKRVSWGEEGIEVPKPTTVKKQFFKKGGSPLKRQKL